MTQNGDSVKSRRRYRATEKTTYPGGSHERTTEYRGDNIRPQDTEHLSQPSGFPILRVILLTGILALLAVALNNAEGIVKAFRLLAS